MSHVTHIIVVCHIYERAMWLLIWMCHVTHVSESCHMHRSIRSQNLDVLFSQVKEVKMTCSNVWRDSSTWLLHFYVAWISWIDMTHSHVGHDPFTCVTSTLSIRRTWIIHKCDMTNSYVWRDLFMRVTYPSICVTWLIHSSQVWTSEWLMQTYDGTHLHDSWTWVFASVFRVSLTWTIEILVCSSDWGRRLRQFYTSHLDVYYDYVRDRTNLRAWHDSSHSKRRTCLRPSHLLLPCPPLLPHTPAWVPLSHTQTLSLLSLTLSLSLSLARLLTHARTRTLLPCPPLPPHTPVWVLYSLVCILFLPLSLSFSLFVSRSLSLCLHVYVYFFLYVCIHVYTYIHTRTWIS